MPHYHTYHSTSFPETFPRVADSPECIFNLPSVAKTSRTDTRAPHSPYTLRSLPFRDYNTRNL